VQRPPKWRDLAQHTELVAVTCYHLFGDENNLWEWEYDIGLRRDEVHQTEIVDVAGQDLILCNGWLARALPKPKDMTDLFLINYRLKDYGWTA